MVACDGFDHHAGLKHMQWLLGRVYDKLELFVQPSWFTCSGSYVEFTTRCLFNPPPQSTCTCAVQRPRWPPLYQQLGHVQLCTLCTLNAVCIYRVRVSQKKVLTECCWSHGADALSPVAGTPVWNLSFWSFLIFTLQDQALPSHFHEPLHSILVRNFLSVSYFILGNPVCRHLCHCASNMSCLSNVNSVSSVHAV